MHCEAVWIAGGRSSYVSQAFNSALSFRRHHPTWQMRLITPNQINKPGIFNTITKVPYNEQLSWYLNVVEWYQDLPNIADYIYLFSVDAYICVPLYGPLRLLTKYDLVGCHSQRKPSPSIYDDISRIEFPEIDTGFIAFRSNDLTSDLIFEWRDLYQAHQFTYRDSELGALCDALWKWDGSFYVLPPEYNVNVSADKSSDTKPRIIHTKR
jgi:hypothetical protein